MLPLLLACAGNTDKPLPAEEGGPDTADTTDPDTADTADTADTTGTEDTGPPAASRLRGTFVIADADASWPAEGIVRPLGDADGDGLGDLVYADEEGLGILWGPSVLSGATGPDVRLRGAAGAYDADAGDLDGDGSVDIVAVLGNYALVWCGPFATGEDVDPCARITGVSGDVLVTDLDADDAPELVLGGMGGSAWVFPNPVARGDRQTSDAPTAIQGDGSYLTSLAAGGDLDGNGVGDLLVGDYEGIATVWLGPIRAGRLPLEDADVRIEGQAVGWAMAGPGDVDGDGQDDLALNEYGSRAFLRVFPGPLAPGDLDPASAPRTWVADGDSTIRRLAPVGDVDGDALADLLVGTSQDPVGAWLLLGEAPWIGTRALVEAPVLFESVDGWGATAGESPVGIGDIDGDGLADIVVTDTGVEIAYLFLSATTAVPSDVDRDGFGVDDCDDADFTVHPARPEDGTDGLDEDCDGAADTPCPERLAAGASVVGTEEGLLLGGQLVAPGDLDGDGIDDLLVGEVGGDEAGALLFSGRWTGERDETSAVARLRNSGYPGVVPATVAHVGDIDGDGLVDLGVEQAVWFGPVSGDLDAATADVTVDDAYVMDGGDLDGDGAGDLVVSYPSRTHGTPGYVRIHPGPGSPGTLEAADARTRYREDTPVAYGFAVAVGDTDGDGVSDLVAGNAWHRLYRYAGPLPEGEFDAGECDTEWFGHDFGSTSALALAGDTDGDGAVELLVGSGTGEAWLLPAGVSGYVEDLDDAALRRYSGAHEDDAFGAALATPGDLDGDGSAEIVLGAPDHDGLAVDGGAVALFRGTTATGTFAFADADAAWFGETAGASLGSSLAAPGDLDGDGRDELATGTPEASTGAAAGGAILLAPWP